MNSPERYAECDCLYVGKALDYNFICVLEKLIHINSYCIFGVS
jgi:hypothetical protein